MGKGRIAITVAAVAAVLVGVALYAGWRTVSPTLPTLRLPPAPGCVVQAGGEVSLDSEQTANAATISAVGIRMRLPARALTVALATSLQESKLRNIPGGDRDSVGLFQQRPSEGWGTTAQLTDARFAAKAFYTALLKVRGWQKMSVTDAAQAVQHSATPDAYARWADDATVLTRALAGDATGAVACVVAADPGRRGTAAVQDLTSGLQADWGQLKTAPAGALAAVALAPADDRTGWQYAHWLVAYAEQRGVKRVRFGDLEWTARAGKWTGIARPSGSAAPPATPVARQVVAEVYPDSA